MSNKNEENSSEEHNKIESYFTKKHKVYPVAQTLKLVIVIAAIVLFIDVQNYPSILMIKFGVTTFWLAIVTVFVIAGITAYEDGLHKQLTLPFINRLDNLVAISGEASLLYLFGNWLIEIIGIIHNGSASWSNTLLSWSYKSWIALVVCVISFVISMIRYYILTTNEQKQQLTNQNKLVYDLKDIYENNFEITPDRQLIIGEINIDYDMLNRKKLINHLTSLLLNSQTDERCVISLEGSWGSGKTTLINNVQKEVKNNEKIIWIDNFDPWNYKNQEAMLNGFLETILHESKIHYRGDRFSKMSATISKLILKTDSNIIDDVFRKDMTVTEFKEQINTSLISMDKKIVMVIDNLDRIDQEQIIFMFDLVGNILNFDSITYIMLYDKDKIEEIFDNNLDRDVNYIDKIINIPLKVPKIDTKRLKDIYKKVLENVLMAYDAEQNISDYEALIGTMINVGIDFRQYKQFINSGVIPYLNKDFYLNKTDMINLEFIKQFNFELYEDIYRHKEYYTCYGENHYDFQWHDKNIFLGHIKNYYEAISKKHNKYTLLIDQLSPYMQFNPDYSIDIFTINNKTKINIEMKLQYWEWFDLYYTFSDNQQVEDSHLVNEFIDKFNNEPSEIIQNNLFTSIFLSNEYERQIVFMRLLLVKNSIILKPNQLLNVICSNIDEIDNRKIPFGTNSLYITIKLISELLLNNNADDVDEFLLYINSSYKNIGYIANILKELDYTQQINETQRNKKIINDLEHILVKLKKEILTKEINMCDKKHYRLGNLNALLNEVNIIEVQTYIKKLLKLNPRYIYIIIYEVMGITTEGPFIHKYCYYKIVEEWCSGKINIEKAMVEAPPKTIAEQEVYDMYWAYNNPEYEPEDSERIEFLNLTFL